MDFSMLYIPSNIFNGFGFFPNFKWNKFSKVSYVFSFGIYSFLFSNFKEEKIVFINTTLYFYDNSYGILKETFDKFTFSLKKYKYKFLKYFYNLCFGKQINIENYKFLIQKKDFNKYEIYLNNKLNFVKNISTKKKFLLNLFKKRIKDKKLVFFISKEDKILPFKSQINFLKLLKDQNISFKTYEILDSHFPKFFKNILKGIT